MKKKLSELIKKDVAGFGFLSAFGWTCSKCVLEGFNVMRMQGAELPDNIEEAIEKWLLKLKCECVPEKDLIIDKEGLEMLKEREEKILPDDEFEFEDVEKPKYVEFKN